VATGSPPRSAPPSRRQRVVVTRRPTTNRAVRKYPGSGNPVWQQVAVLIDRTGQGSDTDDTVVDLHHLGNSTYVALADHEPSSLVDEGGIAGFIEEGPRQAGVVFAVEIDREVQTWYRCSTHRTSPGPW
jgi:hypothetical protein